jgi:serine/threonine protein phosphatase PrpC
VRGDCAHLLSDIIVANVGDCRALLRTSIIQGQLTRDHRACETDELKRIIAAEVRVWNGRVGGVGVLTPSRYFGDLDERESCGEGVIISEPEIFTSTLERGNSGELEFPAASI